MTRQLRRHWLATLIAVVFVPALGIFTLASPPSQEIGTWQVLGALLDAREGATATRLDDGRVLVVGGRNGSGVLRTAEVIGADGSTSATGSLATPRAFHTATLLKDGRVLVTGGTTADGSATASAEIFDPGSGGWAAASMIEARAHHTATIVENGVVVIAGGEAAGVASRTVEVFDPSANAFYGLPSLAIARSYHAAAASDGQHVLVMGGTDGTNVLATTEVIDATTGAVTAGPAMNVARKNFTATSMLNGDILVAGGSDGTKDLSSAEKFSLGAWGQVGGLGIARQGHAAVRLPENAGVLVVGGTAAGIDVTGAELFRPTGAFFTPTGATFTGHAAGALGAGPAAGQAIAAGGAGTASLERYAYATIKTDRDDYAPGETVTITGTGWVPGEWVTLTMVEVPYLDVHPLVSVQADGNGNIISTEFAPDEHDLNIRFYLTAYGMFSEAQNTFTDAITLDSVTVGPQVGILTTGTADSATYTVCLAYHGNNSAITFSVISGLPSGATVSLSPNPTGTSPPKCPTTASTLTITTTAAVPAGTYTFTVQATGGGTVTSTGTLVVNKANATVVVTPYTVTYDGQPHTATYTITGVNGETGATVGTVTLNTTHTAAGTYASDTWSFTGTANYNDIASTIITDTISKAAATVVVTPYTVTYDGNSHTATVTSITGVNGETGATVGTVDVSNTTHTNAGTYTTDSWSFTGTANYNNQGPTTISDAIAKADATFTVTPYNVTYNGSAHTAAVSTITGVNGETGATVGTVDVTNTTHTNAATYATDTWSFTGTANYNNQGPTTISDAIAKADATFTVTPYSVTYDGSAHTASVSTITGVNGETGATVGTVDVTNTTHTNAGTYTTDSWSFTGTANYNNQGPTTITDTIAKADATFTVTPYSVAYDGLPHTATVSTITGVNGETGATVGTVDLSNTSHTNAGTYATDSWSFTGTANYNNQGPTTISDAIAKADATFTVTPYSVAYDGLPHTATVSTITGVNGETGATVGTVDLSNTSHTNAGTYATDTWSFTGTANYNNQGPTTISDAIAKADATFTVTPYSVAYDGLPHTATVSTITGVNGETGATVGTVDLSNTSHTNAGTYATDTWSFTGTANYNNQGPTTISDAIAKADATFTVTPYSVAYDGLPHTATVSTITGVNGETGATVGTVDLSNTSHTNAGTYATDTWSFTGTANYNNQGPTTISDAIAKADATFTVTPYSVAYDGLPHTATVSTITGVNGETGATVGTVDLSNTSHTNAGTYATDTWSFTGTANYNNQGPTTISDAIAKADATFTVTPYSVAYDGLPHTATVSTITGVNGETGATVGTVDLSNTSHTNAGTYATDTWSFTGTANYNNQGPTTITDTIAKADATFTVTPYSVAYNGLPHTATVSTITGVNGETGATVGTVDLSNTSHTNAGTYATDSWSFTGTANYNNQGPTTISDAIAKADATFTVTPYSVAYDGLPHTATVSTITGVNGETGATVGTVDLSNTSHTNAGTYATDTWSFTGTANYNNQGPTTISDAIAKADATFTVTPYSVAYDGLPHTATVSTITGVNGETGATVGTVDLSNTSHTNAGTYATDSWSFTGTANYNNQGPTTISDAIAKADATFTVTPYSVAYDGLPHTATVSTITGVNGETGATVGTVDLSNTSHTNAGTYATDSWSFTGTANYNNQGPTTISDAIAKADATFTVTPYSVAYDGLPHTATVSTITGVNGETGATVGTVDLSNTSHTNAGTYATDTWSFTGTANYNNQGPTTISDAIAKADATFTVTPYSVAYDGLPHTATVSTITGVNGETGATVGTVDLSNTSHTNAGTYATDTWSFTGTANYNNQGPTTISDAIAKADATFTVTPYSVAYDGLPHTATVSTITGVNGETGATVGTVDLSNTSHTNAGTYATDTWSFTGTANYNNQGPTTISDAIAKADATFTVTPYSVAYDGLPHTATVSTITGVNGETGATVGTVDLSNTSHTNAGTYATDTWSFTGTANYNNQGPTTITDTIGKADATVTVTPYDVQWNGQDHTAAYTITGVGGETGATVGTVDVTNTKHKLVGTYGSDTWSFTGTANYNNKGPTTITDMITTGYCFNGFLSPIGGSVESNNGGSFGNPVRAFKLGSTIPVKFVLNSLSGSTCGGVVTTGIHALQAVKYSSAVDSDPPIDATPTDAATAGNLFRLTDSEWHFNLSTKGLSAGTWLLKATLEDGSIKTVWITIKK